MMENPFRDEEQPGMGIRRWRRTLSMTQEELAEMVGCSASQVIGWENGRLPMTGEVYRKLCDALARRAEGTLYRDL